MQGAVGVAGEDGAAARTQPNQRRACRIARRLPRTLLFALRRFQTTHSVALSSSTFHSMVCAAFVVFLVVRHRHQQHRNVLEGQGDIAVLPWTRVLKQHFADTYADMIKVSLYSSTSDIMLPFHHYIAYIFHPHVTQAPHEFTDPHYSVYVDYEQITTKNPPSLRTKPSGCSCQCHFSLLAVIDSTSADLGSELREHPRAILSCMALAFHQLLYDQVDRIKDGFACICLFQ